MTSFKLFGAALVLSAIVAAPVSAQQAIDEPGAYAFYHPNADVLNAGAGGVRAPSNAMAQSLRSGDVGSTQLSVRTRRTHNTAAVRRY
jgi:hypothetical protein